MEFFSLFCYTLFTLSKHLPEYWQNLSWDFWPFAWKSAIFSSFSFSFDRSFEIENVTANSITSFLNIKKWLCYIFPGKCIEIQTITLLLWSLCTILLYKNKSWTEFKQFWVAWHRFFSLFLSTFLLWYKNSGDTSYRREFIIHICFCSLHHKNLSCGFSYFPFTIHHFQYSNLLLLFEWIRKSSDDYSGVYYESGLIWETTSNKQSWWW